MQIKPRPSTAEIECLVADFFKPRINLVVPNVSWGFHGHHECDLFVITKSGYAYEIEIKISKSDLLADQKKNHNHRSNYIRDLYFAIPEHLLPFTDAIPARAGILVISAEPRTYYGRKKYGSDWFFKVGVHRPAVSNTRAPKLTDKDRYCLARLGALRIWGLKKKLNKLKREDDIEYGE